MAVTSDRDHRYKPFHLHKYIIRTNQVEYLCLPPSICRIEDLKRGSKANMCRCHVCDRKNEVHHKSVSFPRDLSS